MTQAQTQPKGEQIHKHILKTIIIMQKRNTKLPLVSKWCDAAKTAMHVCLNIVQYV